ncbi:MAG: ABC transporter ATP-binding protein [Rhodobacterales bacterium]
MSEIILKKIRKSFGKVEVLKEIDLEIRDTEMIVLVGPSGCGKSTLLRIIAGLEEATAGEVIINNTNVADKNPKDRNIAMVFQTYALYPHMTVYQNISFALKMSKVPVSTVDEKVRAAAEMLGLSNLMDRYPRQLSGGQRQRVAMGRALVRDPVAFLFDEPLSNLDAKLRVQMRSEIRLLHQKLKATSIFVTHDQVEAMTMADRIVVMNNGIIEQIGKPLEIYNKPKNSFVAGFIGSPTMNLLPGHMSDRRFNLENGNHIDLDKVNPDWNNKQGIFGIRPEDLVIVSDQEASETETLEVKVKVVEHTGLETLIYGDFGRTEMCLLTKSNEKIKSGDIIRVKVNPDKVHFFED